VLKEDAGIAYRASVIVDDKGVIRAYHVNIPRWSRSPRECCGRPGAAVASCRRRLEEGEVRRVSFVTSREGRRTPRGAPAPGRRPKWRQSRGPHENDMTRSVIEAPPGGLLAAPGRAHARQSDCEHCAEYRGWAASWPPTRPMPTCAGKIRRTAAASSASSAPLARRRRRPAVR
jgi:hypothetical protein